MKKIEGTNGFELSSGKVISFFEGIVGINDELNEIYEGYDGRLDLLMSEWQDKEVVEVLQYTPEEITEICDYAIGLWQKMKEKYGAR